MADGFDQEARTWDQQWEHDPAARHQRARVHEALAQLPPGRRILDLGCGPGVDAAWLARRGHRVVGVDVSPGMLRAARARTEGLDVELIEVDLDRPHTLPPGPFDAALADFGVLNAVRPAPLAAALAERLVGGAPWFAVVMSRTCPAEVLTLLASGHPREALRRRRRGTALAGGVEIPVRYFGPADADALRPWFRLVSIRGLGVVLPPPGHAPGLVPFLAPLDAALGHAPLLRRWGDHTLWELRRLTGGVGP